MKSVADSQDRAIIRAEVLAFYGPHARRRVFRAGSWLNVKRAERAEERWPGSQVTDFIDLIEEAHRAYRRTWTVEDVIEAVADLRRRGYQDIELQRGGSINVHFDSVTDPEPTGRVVPRVPIVRFRGGRRLSYADVLAMIRRPV